MKARTVTTRSTRRGAAPSQPLPDLDAHQARHNFLTLARSLGGLTPGDEALMDRHPLPGEQP